MIPALVSTGLMSVGALAAGLGSHPAVAMAAFGAALAVLVARPWRDVVPTRAATLALLVVAALLASIAIVGTLTGGMRYHSDSVVAAHGAADEVLGGRNPYVTFDLVAQLARFGIPPEYATPLDDGTRLRSFQYPALTFLIPAPFVALGLSDLRALYLVEVMAIFALVVSSVPARWRGAALAACVGNVAVIDQFVNAGVDPLWALLVLLAWRARLRRWSAVALGLAIATRQPAWLIAPFFAAWVWRAYGSREASIRGAMTLGIATLIHLPFLATAPLATIGAILTPALMPLEPWGVGPAKTIADTVGPVIPRGVFLALAAAVYLGALLAFARRPSRGALVHPIMPLWVSWRALTSYFAFLPLFALMSDRSDERIDAHSGSPGARPRLPRRSARAGDDIS